MSDFQRIVVRTNVERATVTEEWQFDVPKSAVGAGGISGFRRLLDEGGLDYLIDHPNYRFVDCHTSVADEEDREIIGMEVLDRSYLVPDVETFDHDHDECIEACTDACRDASQ